MQLSETNALCDGYEHYENNGMGRDEEVINLCRV